MRFILGLIIGIILVPLVVIAYLEYGRVPVAVADPAFPYERHLVHMPLDARIQREAAGTHMEPDAANLTAGARIYDALSSRMAGSEATTARPRLGAPDERLRWSDAHRIRRRIP